MKQTCCPRVVLSSELNVAFPVLAFVIFLLVFLGPSVSFIFLIQSLATQVRKQLHASRVKGEPVEGFNFSTTTMLTKYLKVCGNTIQLTAETCYFRNKLL
jgi:hypothetical protein